MTNKQKLELTWVGKEVRPRLEPGSCSRSLACPITQRTASAKLIFSITD